MLDVGVGSWLALELICCLISYMQDKCSNKNLLICFLKKKKHEERIHFSLYIVYSIFKRSSRRIRPKAHILDDPLDNPYHVLKVLLGSYKGLISYFFGRNMATFSGGRGQLFREE